jgi:hypothetical protein
LPALFIFILFIILSIRKIYEQNINMFIVVSIATAIICLFTAGIFQPDINTGFILLLLSLVNGGNIIPEKYKYAFKVVKK